jgi:aldose 1-epimerase
VFTTSDKTKVILLITFALLLSCSFTTNSSQAQESHSLGQWPQVSKRLWGEVNKQPIWLFQLTNINGMKVRVTNFGAYVQAIEVPDKNGIFNDIILGYDSAQQYVNDCCYNGATVGRFANRIKHGRYSFDEQTYQLTTNNGGINKINHNHGGLIGFNKKRWQVSRVDKALVFTYTSADGEQGYPGKLAVQAKFELSNNNEFIITYSATTTKPTPVNIIPHLYFNLNGDGQGNIEDHQLQINANYITEAEPYLTATGKLLPVKDTPFDFTQMKALGRDIKTIHPQLKLAGGQDKQYGGYDHNWVLANYDGKMRQQAVLFEKITGRKLTISTTQPGLQIYSGNFMNGTVKGKKGKLMANRSGVAIEPQHFPDSPNHSHFPNTILLPEQTYLEVNKFHFSVQY